MELLEHFLSENFVPVNHALVPAALISHSVFKWIQQGAERWKGNSLEQTKNVQIQRATLRVLVV
jgi:hypothetical protein